MRDEHRYCPHYAWDWRPYLMDYNPWEQKTTHLPGIEKCPTPMVNGKEMRTNER